MLLCIVDCDAIDLLAGLKKFIGNTVKNESTTIQNQNKTTQAELGVIKDNQTKIITQLSAVAQGNASVGVGNRQSTASTGRDQINDSFLMEMIFQNFTEVIFGILIIMGLMTLGTLGSMGLSVHFKTKMGTLKIDNNNLVKYRDNLVESAKRKDKLIAELKKAKGEIVV